MNNPYKVDGKPITQFQEQARIWDECIEWIVRRLKKQLIACWGGNRLLLAKDWKELKEEVRDERD